MSICYTSICMFIIIDVTLHYIENNHQCVVDMKKSVKKEYGISVK